MNKVSGSTVVEFFLFFFSFFLLLFFSFSFLFFPGCSFGNLVTFMGSILSLTILTSLPGSRQRFLTPMLIQYSYEHTFVQQQ